MKRLLSIVLLLIFVSSFSTSAIASSNQLTNTANTSITRLEALKTRLTDLQDKEKIEAIIEDVRSGEAVITSLPKTLQTRVYTTYRTFNDNIRLNNVLIGKFYIKCCFDDIGAYEGVDSYWHTKESYVTTLSMVSCEYVYYPANNAIAVLEEYYCYMTGQYQANGNFLEVDNFYF